MKTLLACFLTVAALFLGTQWLQSLAKIKEQDAQIQKQAKEVQQLQQQLAVANATNDMLAKRVQLVAKASFGSVTNEIEASERRQRIPAGATDPDRVWKGQVKAARDLIKAEGMPVGR